MIVQCPGARTFSSLLEGPAKEAGKGEKVILLTRPVSVTHLSVPLTHTHLLFLVRGLRFWWNAQDYHSALLHVHGGSHNQWQHLAALIPRLEHKHTFKGTSVTYFNMTKMDS